MHSHLRKKLILYWLNNEKKYKQRGMEAKVRILLKIRPFDVYEIYMSDKSSPQFNEIALEARNNNITIQNISNDKIYDLTNVKEARCFSNC